MEEVEVLKLQIEGMKRKLKDFKIFRANYALKNAQLEKAYNYLNEALDKETKYRNALENISAADELTTAGKLRRYAAKVVGPVAGW